MTEWLQEPPNDKRSWLSAAEAEAYYAPKSYNRGSVDWRERTKPPYPSTPEQLAIRLPPVEPVEKVKAPKPTHNGHEVDVETLVKRTKKGAINTQSTIGKVVSLATEKGCTVKAWRSEVADGIAGAHHGLRFSVVGATVEVNGRLVPAKDLLVRLEEL